jgi:hypothetical protein
MRMTHHIQGDLERQGRPRASAMAAIEEVKVGCSSHCGLVSDTAPCRCHRRVSSSAVASFSVARPLQFARRSTSFHEARALVRQVDQARSALALYRTTQPRGSAVDFARRLVSDMAGPSGLSG